MTRTEEAAAKKKLSEIVRESVPKFGDKSNFLGGLLKEAKDRQELD